MGNSSYVPVCAALNGTTISLEDVNAYTPTTSIPFFLEERLTGRNGSTALLDATGSSSDVIGRATNSANENAAASAFSLSWLEIVISVLCILGIIGNVLNLFILNSRRMACDRIGRSMNVGLISLAVSDMLFCCCALPYSFIPKNLAPTQIAGIFKFVYRIYGIAGINMFMMTSTWIVMFMSVSRYLGVAYPLKAKSSVCTQKMPLIIVMVYVLSASVTSPYFIHLSVLPCTDGINELYEMRPRFTGETTAKLVFYNRWIWPIVADFIPLLLLVFCNTRLIVELHQSTNTRKVNCPGQSIRSTSNRVTITLVAVVLMLFIFVSPSEILKYINPYKSWGVAGHIVATVTNIMQLVNFCSNFLLYCAVNPKFRAAARGLFLDLCCPWNSSRRSVVGDRSTLDTSLSSKSWKSTYSSHRTAARSTTSLGNSYKKINSNRTLIV